MTKIPEALPQADCRGAAQDYLLRGWSVIPLCDPYHEYVTHNHAEECKRPGKQPLYGWTQFQTRRMSQTEVVSHFKKPVNVGVVFGQVSRLIGLDVDGPEAMALLKALSKSDLPETLHFKTPGNGLRLLYRIPTNLVVPKRRFDQNESHVIILGEGSYTVMPPSRHRNGGLYGVLIGKLADAPDWILTLPEADHQVGGHAHQNTHPVASNSPPTSPKAIKRARAYLAECDPSIDGAGGSKQVFKIACKLIHGFHLDQETALQLMQEDWNHRCVHKDGGPSPWSEKELRHTLNNAAEKGKAADMGQDYLKQTVVAKQAGASHFECPVAQPKQPGPLDQAALFGLAGQLVQAIEPHSESDPAALLVQTLVAFGNSLGRTAHFVAEGDTHYLNLFSVLVGESSKARKGSSWGHIRKFFGKVDPIWAEKRIGSGLSSGEGLIWAVRDPIWKRERFQEKGQVWYEDVEVDGGIEDKRLLCYEGEFASVLKAVERQGNILSALIRHAYDTGNLSQMVKNNPATATGACVSIIGHITVEELRRYLSATEQANGFANRFLWLLVKRSKLLPLGGQLAENALDGLCEAFQQAASFARSQGAIGFDGPGEAAWCAAYSQLADGRHGLAGCLLNRAEAQVRRLACVYAMLDLSPVVRPEHLQAALALWKYVEESVRFIFGDSTGDPLADELLALISSKKEGVTREEMRQHFNGHRDSNRIAKALTLLLALKLAHFEKLSTKGRPAEVWFPGPAPA